MRRAFAGALLLTFVLSGAGGAHAQSTDEGARLYAVNCSMCHGGLGVGDGPVAKRFVTQHFVPPADLTSTRVRNRTDGELNWIITNGEGNMPPFRDLLTEDQVWTLVQQVRTIEGQR